ncbi:hypothetical protein B7P43_G02624 [Cryptotermes secundus]|uniref:Uncharacterized protein n=1 Tax=Cryptotermes secundus TaxID=105785 RepID=A0A2J7PP76_9NEOP|nr:hypothetical protein B7P43_G02624 [Cryptotermes secundus]
MYLSYTLSNVKNIKIVQDTTSLRRPSLRQSRPFSFVGALLHYLVCCAFVVSCSCDCVCYTVGLPGYVCVFCLRFE